MGIMDRFSKEELECLVRDSTSYRELSGKLGYRAKGKSPSTIARRLEALNISTAHFTGRAKGAEKRTPANVFCRNSTASQAVLRRYYLAGGYTEYQCAICGLPPFWNGLPLTLTLDHIDGDNKNNELLNLRWVCPNCDRQLPTFGSKNFRTSRKTHEGVGTDNASTGRSRPRTHRCIDCGADIVPSAQRCEACARIARRKTVWPARDILKDLIRTKPFVAVGEQFGVSGKTICKWCRHYGLPDKAADIKACSEETWAKL